MSGLLTSIGSLPLRYLYIMSLGVVLMVVVGAGASVGRSAIDERRRLLRQVHSSLSHSSGVAEVMVHNGLIKKLDLSEKRRRRLSFRQNKFFDSFERRSFSTYSKKESDMPRNQLR